MKKILELVSKLYSGFSSFGKVPDSDVQQTLLEEDLEKSFFQANIIYLILWILGAYGLIYDHIAAVLITLLIGSLTAIYILYNKKKDLKVRIFMSIGKMVDNIKVIILLITAILIIIYGFSFYNAIIGKYGEMNLTYSDAKIVFNVFAFYGGVIFGTMLLIFMIANYVKYGDK